MDRRLLDAAVSGDAAETIKHLALHDPGKLLATTPQGNTCLHISTIHGHHGFFKDVLALNQQSLSLPLLTAVNADGETPLLAAVTRGRATLASALLRSCLEQQLRETILKQDRWGCNALHHAIRCGHRELALELIAAEPALSCAVNQSGESPMFIAVMRNDAHVFEKLLAIPDSAHGGACGYNALHAAVRNGNSAITKMIMETRPSMAREENERKTTPMHVAVLWGKTDVLRVLLEHDRSLGYVVSSNMGASLLTSAAYRGHVGAARELLKHCPDAPYCDANGFTCLHQAVWHEQAEFVDFVLCSPQLRRLVNMRDSKGDTALLLAVQKCNPKMVAALLRHQDIDVTLLQNDQNSAI